MAFEAKKLDATLINNNTEYQEGDALQPSAINDMVEGILYNQENASGSNVAVDSELSTESENPVQNKVVTEALNGKVGITDYATPTKAGVVKQGSGFYMSSDGILQLNKTATNWSQDTLTTNMSGASNIAVMAFSIPKMVKISLINPDLSKNEVTKANWTEEEKALARETIGATKLYKHTWEVSYYNEDDGDATQYIHFYATATYIDEIYRDETEIVIDPTYIVGIPYCSYSRGGGDICKQMTAFPTIPGYSFSYTYDSYTVWTITNVEKSYAEV